jgi:hypothetical protein
MIAVRYVVVLVWIWPILAGGLSSNVSDPVSHAVRFLHLALSIAPRTCYKQSPNQVLIARNHRLLRAPALANQDSLVSRGDQHRSACVNHPPQHLF